MWLGGGAFPFVGGVESCPMGGQDMSRGAFWCACEYSKTLGSLSNNGHVFLSC